MNKNIKLFIIIFYFFFGCIVNSMNGQNLYAIENIQKDSFLKTNGIFTKKIERINSKEWSAIIEDFDYSEVESKLIRDSSLIDDDSDDPFISNSEIEVNKKGKIVKTLLRILFIVFFTCLVLWTIYKIASNRQLFYVKDKFITKDRQEDSNEIALVEPTKEKVQVDDLENIREFTLKIQLKKKIILLLNKFQDHGLVAIQKDKTLMDYINELERTDYVIAYKSITNSFNFYWHGEKNLTIARYEELVSQIDHLLTIPTRIENEKE